MRTHPNAWLTPLGWEPLLRRHIHGSEPLRDLAVQAGISLRIAYKWLDLQQLQRAFELRHQRCTLRRIARPLGAPVSTVGRALDTQLHEDAHRYRGNGVAAMATQRTAALNLLRLAGFRSIRSGMQAVIHDIKVLLAMVQRSLEPELY